MSIFIRPLSRPEIFRIHLRKAAAVDSTSCDCSGVADDRILGEGSTTKLLILSQVILSLQLSFAVIPLIMFTSDRQLMGDFVNPRWMKILAWSIATVIVGLNSWLLVQTFWGWMNLH